MKNLFITTLLTLSVSFSVGQTPPITESTPAALNPSVVPGPAINAFTIENPGVTGTWRADDKNFRVNYIDGSTKLGRIIIYDKDGNVLRRENEVDNMIYPGSIKEIQEKKYPGETFQVWTSEDKEKGTPVYYTDRHNERVWFDKDGKEMDDKKVNITPKPKK